MTQNLNIYPQAIGNSSFNVRQERRQLLRAFWLGVTILLLFELYTVQSSSLASIGSAILIAFTALLPVYLWCSGKALGMPIFPIFSLTHLWTHALPLVGNNQKILSYPPEKHLFAGVTVAGFLFLGTIIWFRFVKKPPAAPKSYLILRVQNSEGMFLTILAAGIFFNMFSLGGWFELSSGIFAIVRSTILGLNVLSVFVLSYRCGTRELVNTKSTLFWILLAFYIITSAASLLLVNALSVVFLAATAFISARRKVPWLPIVIVLFCLSFLHYGKAEMRQKYWGINDAKPHLVQPWEYPAWYGEWADRSFANFNSQKSWHKSEEKASFLERSSVIHMLLMTETKAPSEVPYLSGTTYAILPQLLVPRIFNTSKIRSHEGTYLLNIYYGLQDRHSTLTTTIGWGLLSEAYANYGLWGCAGLATILGAVYGQATRWSLNTPLLSFRSLFGVLLMSFAFQTEWTAGVYVAALSQSLVILGSIAFVFMKTHTHKAAPFITYGFGNAGTSQLNVLPPKSEYDNSSSC